MRDLVNGFEGESPARVTRNQRSRNRMAGSSCAPTFQPLRRLCSSDPGYGQALAVAVFFAT